MKSNMHSKGKNKARKRKRQNQKRKRDYGGRLIKAEGKLTDMVADLRRFVPQVSQALVRAETICLLLAKFVTEGKLEEDEMNALEEFVAMYEEEGPDESQVQSGEDESKEPDPDEGQD